MLDLQYCRGIAIQLIHLPDGGTCKMIYNLQLSNVDCGRNSSCSAPEEKVGPKSSQWNSNS